jgi:hypothetical protein
MITEEHEINVSGYMGIIRYYLAIGLKRAKNIKYIVQKNNMLKTQANIPVQLKVTVYYKN